MSASRRRAAELQLESIYLLAGPEQARLWVDQQRTGYRCPACRGKRFWTITEMNGVVEKEGRSPTVNGKVDRFECNTCKGQGALRPRSHCRERNEDFAIVHGMRP